MTGASGYIGMHACQALKNTKHEVIAFSRSNPFEKIGIQAWIQGDIRDRQAIISAAVGCDSVLHLACMPMAGQKDISLNFQTNLDGTRNALEAARINGCQRFVNVSSSQVLGFSDELPQNEETYCYPNSPYGVAKRGGEILCSTYQRDWGLNCVTLRLFNVYGRLNDSRERNSIDEIFIRDQLSGNSSVIRSHPDEGRDFVHIQDVQQALLLALDLEKNIPGGIYTIGSGRLTTFPELARIIAHILGNSLHMIFKNENSTNLMRLQADISKASATFGFTPEIRLEKGLELLAANYLRNGALKS